MADRLYSTLQFPMLAPGATSAPMAHGLNLNQTPILPNLIAAPGCAVDPALDVTSTTIRVTNSGLVAFAPQVWLLYLHDIARVLGVVGTVQPSINPFVITGAGGGGGGGASDHVIASPPDGVVEGLVSDWNGATGTDNSAALQAAFAALTTLKRAMYTPGQYMLGDAGPVIMSAGQKVNIFGDGDDGQSLIKFNANPSIDQPFQVDGASLRLEQMAIEGGPAGANCNLFGVTNRSEADFVDVALDGLPGENTTGPVGTRNSKISMIGGTSGPNFGNVIRTEEAGTGGLGPNEVLVVGKRLEGTDDLLLLDNPTQLDAFLNHFVAATGTTGQLGTGGLVSDTNPAGSGVPDHSRVMFNRFDLGVAKQIFNLGIFPIDIARNTHTIGQGNTGILIGTPTTVDRERFDSEQITPWGANTQYSEVGTRAHNDGQKIYVVTAPGSSGNLGGPTGTGAVIPDPGSPNGLVWAYTNPGVAHENGYTVYDTTVVASAHITPAGNTTPFLNSIGNISSGVVGANVRGANTPTDRWEFHCARLANYHDLNGIYNVVWTQGELRVIDELVTRVPRGTFGQTGAYFVGGGSAYFCRARVTDPNTAAGGLGSAYLQGPTADDLEVTFEDCGFAALVFLEPRGHKIKVYGRNHFCTGFSGGFLILNNPELVEGYLQNRRVPDPTPQALVGSSVESHGNYDLLTVTGANPTIDLVRWAEVYRGPWGLRSSDAAGLTLATGGAAGAGYYPFRTLKTAGATPQWVIRRFLFDPIAHVLDEI